MESNKDIYVISIFYNPNDDEDLIIRFNIFKSLLENKGFKLILVKSNHINKINNLFFYDYEFTNFNYYKALTIGINKLPIDWKYVLICDINILFLNNDFEKNILKTFEEYEVMQFFKTSIYINNENFQITDTNFSLAYSISKKIPFSPNLFPLWFPDSNGFGMNRKVYEEIKNDIAILSMQNEFYMYHNFFNDKDKLIVNINNILLSKKIGYAKNIVYKFVNYKLCQYEVYNEDIKQIVLNRYNISIYPEININSLDYLLLLNDTKSKKNLIKNIFNNIITSSIENEITLVKFDKQYKIVQEKIMTLELMNDDLSTLMSDNELFTDELEIQNIYNIEDKLVSQFGACQSCKPVNKKKETNINNNNSNPNNVIPGINFVKKSADQKSSTDNQNNSDINGNVNNSGKIVKVIDNNKKTKVEAKGIEGNKDDFDLNNYKDDIFQKKAEVFNDVNDATENHNDTSEKRQDPNENDRIKNYIIDQGSPKHHDIKSSLIEKSKTMFEIKLDPQKRKNSNIVEEENNQEFKNVDSKIDLASNIYEVRETVNNILPERDLDIENILPGPIDEKCKTFKYEDDNIEKNEDLNKIKVFKTKEFNSPNVKSEKFELTNVYDNDIKGDKNEDYCFNKKLKTFQIDNLEKFKNNKSNDVCKIQHSKTNAIKDIKLPNLFSSVENGLVNFNPELDENREDNYDDNNFIINENVEQDNFNKSINDKKEEMEYFEGSLMNETLEFKKNCSHMDNEIIIANPMEDKSIEEDLKNIKHMNDEKIKSNRNNIDEIDVLEMINNQFNIKEEKSKEPQKINITKEITLDDDIPEVNDLEFNVNEITEIKDSNYNNFFNDEFPKKKTNKLEILESNIRKKNSFNLIDQSFEERYKNKGSADDFL